MSAAVLKSLLSNIENYVTNQSPEFVIQIPDAQLKVEDKVERVPPLFRSKQSHNNAYDPVIVSMGPYYHGKPEYQHAEAFKQESLNAFLSESPMDKLYYHNMILEKIKEIRGCYENLGEKFTNEVLAALILNDACFFIYYVKNHTTANSSSRANKFSIFYKYFGPARIKFIFRDLILVENQIPFWIIQHLMDLSLDGKSWYTLLGKFMSSFISGGNSTTHPWPNNSRPFHFLGAYYQALRKQLPVSLNLEPSNSEMSMGEINPEKSNTFRFRSITNLKAKGIRFQLSKPTVGQAIIRFDSCTFYGRLHLPRLFFSTNYFVLYSNLIAYEMSPTSHSDLFVSSLVNFLKSLIDGPNDVKILREKGILLNDMVSDDEVVKVVKDLDTFGLDNVGAFSKVRDSIEVYCSSKIKIWLAEFIHTNLESPWTALALLGALLIVALTMTQTYYATNPAK